MDFRECSISFALLCYRLLDFVANFIREARPRCYGHLQTQRSSPCTMTCFLLLALRSQDRPAGPTCQNGSISRACAVWHFCLVTFLVTRAGSSQAQLSAWAGCLWTCFPFPADSGHPEVDIDKVWAWCRALLGGDGPSMGRQLHDWVNEEGQQGKDVNMCGFVGQFAAM